MYDAVMTNGHGTTGIIPSILSSLLQQRGITAAELARRTGISKSTISLILAGKRQTTTSANAMKLADELNVSVDYLIGNSTTPEPTTLMLGELLLELTQVARHLTPSQQRDLLAMANTYLEQNEEARQAGKARLMEDVLSLVRKYGGEVSEDRLINLLETTTGNRLAEDAGRTGAGGVDALGDDDEEPA